MGSADGNIIRIGDSEFDALIGYVKKHYGINLSKKRALIEGRLNGYLISNGHNSYKSYLETLFGDKTGGEMSSMINYLTTNYSYFMREKEHFDYLVKHILPELKRTVKDKDLRIWSAGCSTGEEAYTLCMVITDFFGAEGALWDKRVLATDISQKALEAAKKGVYGKEALSRLPASWRLSNFEKLPDGNYRVMEHIRKEVIFRRFNLMETFPFKKKFHVIFCRNVMMYFDQDAKRALAEKFYDATAPGGYLIVGLSETLNRAECRYSYVMPSIFRKEG